VFVKRLVVMWGWVVACNAGEVIPDRDSDDGLGIQCEDPIAVDVTVTGTAADADDDPVPGATVSLIDVAAPRDPQERPLTFGTAVADASGRFTVIATDLEWFPNCNLLFTDYTMRATTEAGLRGDDDINFELFQVIGDGSFRIEMNSSIQMEAR
jgi:hypothetical protein